MLMSESSLLTSSQAEDTDMSAFLEVRISTMTLTRLGLESCGVSER